MCIIHPIPLLVGMSILVVIVNCQEAVEEVHKNPGELIHVSRILQKRAFTPDIDFKKVTGIWGPDASISFTYVILANNLFAFAGWILAGFIYAGVSENPSKGIFSYLFGPQATAVNAFRCIVVFVTMFAGLFLKTLITLGMHTTMEKYMAKTPSDVMKFLTRDDFLREIIGRGIMTAVFQLLGWIIIGKIAGSRILVGPEMSKKRKKRQTISRIRPKNPTLDPMWAKEQYFQLVPKELLHS
eukprot:TCALIF_09552-PA protein Name:"Protein of unknown function" AED:0.40 eAED:0.40 QI:88/1/0/1/1/1/2/0/240